MAKRWSESDLRFLRDNADKMDVQTLADRLGARIDEVEARIEKLGLRQGDRAAARKQPASFREMFRHSEAARREYERGVASLQKKKFDDAEKHFRALVNNYGDEKELVDRARLYLAVCERHKKPAKGSGMDHDDPYYAALFEKNRENYQAAIEHLKKAARREDGRAAFLLACCYAQMSEVEKAIEALERAIAEDEDNRALARRDPDFDGLRDMPEFQTLTAATA
jgi:tetratricopeptide (TPR) repeat protein